MKFLSMAAASAFTRISRSQSAKHFVGAHRATSFGFAFSSFSNGGRDSVSSKFPRPKTVAWCKELANTVHLIGNINNPVQLKKTEEGQVFASANLGVKLDYKSIKITWYQLIFLGELIGPAAEHLKAFDRVYVSGRLEFEKVVGEDNDMHTLYQVWVDKLNFIELTTTSMNASLRNQDFEVNRSAFLQSKISEDNSTASLQRKAFEGSSASLQSRNSEHQNLKSSAEDNSTAFHQSKAFEVSSSSSLKSRESEDQNVKFSVADKRIGINTARNETLWQAFFDDPTKWWDNRNNKKNPNAPDFKHKDTDEVLWIDSFNNPSWVKSKLDTLD